MVNSQLETFEIIECKPFQPSFLQFLKSQKSSLKNLTLDGGNFDDEIANFVYFEMNLDKIVDYRSKHGQIIKLKKTSVKNLAINSENDNFEYFEKLFQCCEMLEVLSVNLPSDKPVEFLQLLSKLPHLKYLKLDCHSLLKSHQQPTFKFSRLEKLTFPKDFYFAHQGVKIIRCCPNLTHVKMFNVCLDMGDSENIFEACNKIQEIYLDLQYHVSDEDIEAFKIVGSKIKLKIESDDKNIIDNLCDTKNGLTVFSEVIRERDQFMVRPK